MKTVNSLRSVVSLGRSRWENSSHRTDDVRRAPARVGDHVPRKFRPVTRGLIVLALLALAGSPAAQATAESAPVLIGSVNPTTRAITIFQDLLVDQFLDGGPIQHLYGQHDKSKGFFLVRAGKSVTGECVTETFKLTRLSNNGLVLASRFSPVWDYIGFLRPTLRCTSPTCTGCIPHQTTATSLAPSCECGSGVGLCDVADLSDLPGYTIGEILLD